MFDTNLMFGTSKAITADGYMTNALLVGPGEYVTEIITEAFTGFSTVSVRVEESSDGSTYTPLAYAEPITGKQSRRIVFNTRKEYLKMYVDITGSGSITLTAGIVMAPGAGVPKV